MKTLEVLLLVAVFVTVNCHTKQAFDLKMYEKAELTVIEAIKKLFQNYYCLEEPKVDIMYIGMRSEALAEKLLCEKPPEVSLRVIRLEELDQVNLSSPAILLVDSYELYYKHFIKINKNNLHPVWSNLLIFVPVVNGQDLIAAYQAHSVAIDNANFLRIVNDSTVDLVTGFSFEPGKFRQPQYKTINRFSASNMKWDNDTFFPEKYENFNGCELGVAIDDKSNLAEWPATTTTSTTMINILAQHLNFTPVYVPMTKDVITSRNYDLMSYVSGQIIGSYLHHDFSSALYSDHVTLTVPAGEPYTQLEKMFLMFDKETWICIGVTLAGALLVIQVINLMSVQVQKFVFGRDVRSPTLNVANVFLNGAQMRVPGRNFARFLLMMFIIWSLIIRTCYQSMLYENLQKDMRKPRIKTFDELNEKNFTIFVPKEPERHLGEELVRR
jgi:hypothetical protein